MIHPKKLIEMARKWHRRSSSSTDKGHFVVYAMDGERFTVPLSYLHSEIFGELLRMAEDEFGLPNDGPIVIPCDASLVKRLICLVKRQRQSLQDVDRRTLFLPAVGFGQQEAVC